MTEVPKETLSETTYIKHEFKVVGDVLEEHITINLARKLLSPEDKGAAALDTGVVMTNLFLRATNPQILEDRLDYDPRSGKCRGFGGKVKNCAFCARMAVPCIEAGSYSLHTCTLGAGVKDSQWVSIIDELAERLGEDQLRDLFKEAIQ